MERSLTHPYTEDELNEITRAWNALDEDDSDEDDSDEEEDDIPKCSVCEERSGEYDNCERCYKVFCVDHYNHLCGRFCKICDEKKN